MSDVPGQLATSQSAPASPPPLASRLGYRFVRAAFKVRQRYAERLAEVGLAPNQHAILSTLNELGPCHQKALAERVVLDPGDIVAYLDGLQRGGLVLRERDPADRRRQIVAITAPGRAILATSDALLDAVEQEVFGMATEDERRLLSAALVRISAI